ncbi:hypothetical protein Cst04h_03010 [Corynebacterium striatum]|uniref:Uncharacterized protein n=1 Tax=Corynebacterium striatum TaxID=43770 RepID=A0ABC9ZJD2_CORST|nr:hypothetical protein Cst04h_03010 [Corynebacterium striatum]
MEAPKTHPEDEPPPQALGYPVGEEVSEEKKLALWKQVTVGLVLQLAQGEDLGVSVQGAAQKPQWVRGEVMFGVGDGQPKRLAKDNKR